MTTLTSIVNYCRRPLKIIALPKINNFVEPAPYSIEAPSVRPLRVDIADLQCIRISSADDEYTEMKPRKSFDLGKTCKLTLTQKDGTTLPGLVFPSGSAEKFMEILNPFLNLRRYVVKFNLHLLFCPVRTIKVFFFIFSTLGDVSLNQILISNIRRHLQLFFLFIYQTIGHCHIR